MDYHTQKNYLPVGQTLSHAQSLRAIGQVVEALRLKSFELHKNGTEYTLRLGISGSAGKLSWDEQFIETIAKKFWARKQRPRDLKIPVARSDIDRLDAEGLSRRGGASGGMSATADLSLSLRVVGDFLDQKRAVTFSISWSPHWVMVQYQTPNGSHSLQDFATANLYDRTVHELGVRMYLRRYERS